MGNCGADPDRWREKCERQSGAPSIASAAHAYLCRPIHHTLWLVYGFRQVKSDDVAKAEFALQIAYFGR